MASELTLVPPRRLGVLLLERRLAAGTTIDELAARSGGRYRVSDLIDVEQGRRFLADDTVAELARLYQVDVSTVVPARSVLVVDLDAGSLGVDHEVLSLPDGGDLDTVLDRYLALLHLLRGTRPGTRLPLREADLDALAMALEGSVTQIERRLAALMLAGGGRQYPSLRERLAVPAAGLLVGLTTVGALVLIPAPHPPGPTLHDVGAAALTSTTGAGVTGGAELGPATRVERDFSAAGSRADEEAVRVGLAALEMVSWPWQQHLPGWTVRIAGPDSGLRGNTNIPSRTVTVHVRPGDTPESVAGVLAHELGHAIDVTWLGEAERNRWLQARGMDGPWWVEAGAADFHVGSGDFAEAVAALLVGSPSKATHGPFTDAQLDLARQLVPGL